ncbi:hypothetical protein [Flavobacterium sp. 102]|uniref:hypothetical protein n=1 Tax=Flavobacterium sp. 102 TaxID=2135623 RepID=UPI000EB536D1|nr:hypothetical protein [Flavobacterium sp. 102]RKS00458.1 hypothetical protein C8C84_0068 [Flavobacterium sp. 102]
MTYKVIRDSDGMLTQKCPVNIGVKIGSFDCTANCQHNQNTAKELEKYGFEIPEIKCSKANELPSQDNQLTIEI